MCWGIWGDLVRIIPVMHYGKCMQFLNNNFTHYPVLHNILSHNSGYKKIHTNLRANMYSHIQCCICCSLHAQLVFTSRLKTSNAVYWFKFTLSCSEDLPRLFEFAMNKQLLTDEFISTTNYFVLFMTYHSFST